MTTPYPIISPVSASESLSSPLRGLWLPLITPFLDGAVDRISLRRLVHHYAAQPLDGLILAATTGESLTLDHDEIALLVGETAEALATATLPEGGNPPALYLGLSGSDTRKVVSAMARAEHWPLDGYLVTCPYFTRPSQPGLCAHFTALAHETQRPLMIYNIPYRTGVNMTNETLLTLAAVPNIVGVKDCCGDSLQSFDLIRQKPADFSVMTGEDAHFYAALTQGAEGGILAAAHIETELFATVLRLLESGGWPGALKVWQNLADLPRLLFAEPSPAPIKHWLWRSGLIASPEVRLPMTGITPVLAARLDQERLRRQHAPALHPAAVAVR